MNPTKVLFVATSHDTLGVTNGRTGVWLEELASPYYFFKEAGVEVSIASPRGGLVPLDPKSQSIILATFYSKRFLKDEEAKNFLSHSIALTDVKIDDFDVIFLCGGHGCMWDFVDNEVLAKLLESSIKEGKPIGAVSHGVVALLSLKNDQGDFFVKAKQLTCFSNSEEESSGLSGVVPFLLESRLVSLGSIYSKAENYVSCVVVEGNIITGQNPASSKETAQRILALVKHNKFNEKLQVVGS